MPTTRGELVFTFTTNTELDRWLDRIIAIKREAGGATVTVELTQAGGEPLQAEVFSHDFRGCIWQRLLRQRTLDPA